MKKFKVILLLGIIPFLFTSCIDHDKRKYETFQKNANEIYPVGKNKNGEDVFIKGVNIVVGETTDPTHEKIIQTLYLYCDKEGNLLGSGPIHFTQQNGKTQELISIQ